jgi:oligopeptide transport system substrate-binding protein
VDWLGNPFGIWNPSYLDKDMKDNDSKVIQFPDCRVCWCSLNTSSFPFNNHKLRRAFAYAIKRSQLELNIGDPINSAYSILPPHHRENSSAVFPEYDRELALQHLYEALHELGVDRKYFRIDLICNESGIQKSTALALKQQFKEILDVECNIRHLPWSKQFKQMAEGHYEMGLVYWTSWIDDPIYTLGYFKSAKQDVNFCKWEHPEFQHLLDLSEQEIDPKKRHSYLLKAEHILCRYVPIIPLFYFASHALVRKGLEVKNLSSNLSFNVARSFYFKQPQPEP